MKLEVGSMKSEVGANHVGEFMRRYSPLMRRGKPPTIDRRRRGESCRRIYASLFALDTDNPIQTPPH